MSKSTVVILQAHSSDKTSDKFRCYLRDGFSKPKGKVTMRLEEGSSRDGNPVLRLSNSNVGLVVSHDETYLANLLTGFRRKSGEDVFVICSLWEDVIPAVKDVNELEVF